MVAQNYVLFALLDIIAINNVRSHKKLLGKKEMQVTPHSLKWVAITNGLQFHWYPLIYSVLKVNGSGPNIAVVCTHIYIPASDY